jgi:hypothetical protein
MEQMGPATPWRVQDIVAVWLVARLRRSRAEFISCEFLFPWQDSSTGEEMKVAARQ